MYRPDKKIIALALCMAGLAGYVDAVGFLQLGGYFVSFMSGNSTRMVVDLVRGDWRRVAFIATTIAFFVVGAGAGMLARDMAGPGRQAQAVLSFVTALLAGAAACYGIGLTLPAIMMMTLAMGAENAALRGEHHAMIGVTYVTGTLAKLGQGLVNTLLGRKEDSLWLPYLLRWLGLITGGFIGALLFMRFGMYSLWFAAAWAGILTIVTGWMPKS